MPLSAGALAPTDRRLGLIEDRDGAAVAVDAEEQAGADDPGGGADVDNGGQAIFARDDRAVREDAADLGSGVEASLGRG